MTSIIFLCDHIVSSLNFRIGKWLDWLFYKPDKNILELHKWSNYSDHNHTMFSSLNLCHQGPVVVLFPSRTTLTDNLQHAKTQFWPKIIHTANSDIDHFSVCNYCFFFQFKDIYWQMTWYSLLKPCGKLDMPCGVYSECNYQLKLLWMCVAGAITIL